MKSILIVGALVFATAYLLKSYWEKEAATNAEKLAAYKQLADFLGIDTQKIATEIAKSEFSSRWLEAALSVTVLYVIMFTAIKGIK